MLFNNKSELDKFKSDDELVCVKLNKNEFTFAGSVDYEKIIDKFNISTIPVYIDNNNFNKYFVDYEEIGRYIKNS